MSANFVGTIKKLQKALNMKGHRFLYCTTEFYSTNLKRPITMFYVKYAEEVPGGGYNNKILFKSASQLRVLFFMRDVFSMVDSGQSIDVIVDKALELQKGYQTRHDMMQENK